MILEEGSLQRTYDFVKAEGEGKHSSVAKLRKKSRFSKLTDFYESILYTNSYIHSKVIKRQGLVDRNATRNA